MSGRKNPINYVCVYDESNLETILRDVVKPYLNEEEFIVDGYVLKKSIIKRIKVVESDRSIKDIKNYKQSRLSPGVIYVYTSKDVIDSDDVNDITHKTISEVLKQKNNHPNANIINKADICDKNKVFIVHGRDNLAKIDVARFLEHMGLEPVILHEQASCGKTIIEKIEEYTDVGYGIVLYTPCDKGGLENCKESELKHRARQNVVFEHGYLIGKLGRDKVCALMKDDVEYPNDISGVLYIKYQDNDVWKLELSKELKRVGYSVDLNKLV